MRIGKTNARICFIAGLALTVMLPQAWGQTILQPLSQTVSIAKATPAKKPTAKTVAKPSAKPAIKPASGGKVLSGSASKNVQEAPPVKFDLLREIPLEVSGYAGEMTFPERFTSADQIISIVNNKRNLLIHMEAIRRAYKQLPVSEQDKLLTSLFERYREVDDDPVRFFDHGYAQLVMRNNKTGLFFLRKANDAIKDQFSSLAYGAAEVEADINFEDGKPEEMTQRKVDAIFRLKDAVRRDAEKHKPGFWPSYVRLVQKIDTLPAYRDFSSSDLSVHFVPYGNVSVPNLPAPAKAPSQTEIMHGNAGTCAALPPFQKDAAETLFQDRYVDLLGTGGAQRVQVYTTATPNLYHIVMWDGNRVISDLKAPVSPQVIEDLDGDKQFELVIRQYGQDPMNPVQVYRYQNCKFELDKSIEERFH